MNKIITTLAFLAVSAGLFAQCTSCPIPFVGTTQAVGSTTSVTIARPNGVQPGDVMIAAVHDGWCNQGSTVTPPSGWTLINHTSNTGSGCGPNNTTKQLATFYKVVTNAEPLNYTFTGTTSQLYVGGIVAYSGVNATTPINASSNFGTQDACNNIVANSVTTTASCTRLVAVFFCSVNNSLNNIIPQNSLTERMDIGTTGNHPWGNENLEISDELFSGMGASGNKTAALSGCSSTGWVTGAQLIALNCQSTTGISEQELSASISIVPNPSNGVFQLTATGTIKNVKVYSVLGEEIGSHWNGIQLDLGTAPKGIYFVRIAVGEGVVTRRVVVE